MECLGINGDDGTVYEGRLNIGFRTQPSPILVPINFPAVPLPEHLGPVQGFAQTIFREDSFDPVTRIRRGRVFRLYGGGQPRQWHVHDPIRSDLAAVSRGGGMAQEIDRVFLYSRDSLNDLRKSRPSASDSIAILGAEPFIELWKIQSIEQSVWGTPILTLRATRSLSGIPDIDFSRIAEDTRLPLREAMDYIENANHRQGPVDVVDRCRAALAILFGIYCSDPKTDLGKLITKAESIEPPRLLACWAAGIVNRLHPRGKLNEKKGFKTRSIDEADAQLAINCTGLVIKEFALAKPEQ